MRRVGDETGVGDGFDERVGRKEVGDSKSRETVLESSESESLDTSEGEVAVEGRGDGSAARFVRKEGKEAVSSRSREGEKEEKRENEPSVLQEPETLESLLTSLSDDQSTHDHVRVTCKGKRNRSDDSRRGGEILNVERTNR